MVLKRRGKTIKEISQFENDVKMYGTETKLWERKPLIWFENDIKMYGAETLP